MTSCESSSMSKTVARIGGSKACGKVRLQTGSKSGRLLFSPDKSCDSEVEPCPGDRTGRQPGLDTGE